MTPELADTLIVIIMALALLVGIGIAAGIGGEDSAGEDDEEDRRFK